MPAVIPQGPDVLQVGLADAVNLLQEVLDGVPESADPRSEFFVQWRARALAALGQVFRDGAGPAEQFRAIEFGPRRLSGGDGRDDALRRDACRAGCAAARELLGRAVRRVGQLAGPPPAGLDERGTQAGTPDGEGGPSSHDPPPDEVRAEHHQLDERENGVAAPRDAPASPDLLRREPMSQANLNSQSSSPTSSPTSPAATHGLAAAARRSLGRAMVAWDRAGPDAVAVASARLLSDLTLLAADPQFAAAFDEVWSATADGPAESADDGAAGRAHKPGPHGAAPALPAACWSLLVVLHRLARRGGAMQADLLPSPSAL